MPGKLQDRVAVITGAAGGIGEATALLFASEGARIAVVDLTQAAAEGTARRISTAGGRAIAIGGDVTVTAEVRRIIDRAVAELGPLSILVNNAGVDLEGRINIVDVSEEAFDRTVAVNLKGPWLMTKHAVPAMIAAGGGAIINVASLAAYIAASSAGYCASKAGVVALSKVAAVELAQHNIRVNTLCPGATETPMARHEREKLVALGHPTASDLIDRMSVFGRMAAPEEMARAMLFLASEDSSYVTGHSLNVDGGWLAMSGVRKV